VAVRLRVCAGVQFLEFNFLSCSSAQRLYYYEGSSGAGRQHWSSAVSEETQQMSADDVQFFLKKKIDVPRTKDSNIIEVCNYSIVGVQRVFQSCRSRNLNLNPCSHSRSEISGNLRRLE
jgi:hypothetical protein